MTTQTLCDALMRQWMWKYLGFCQVGIAAGLVYSVFWTSYIITTYIRFGRTLSIFCFLLWISGCFF